MSCLTSWREGIQSFLITYDICCRFYTDSFMKLRKSLFIPIWVFLNLKLKKLNQEMDVRFYEGFFFFASIERLCKFLFYFTDWYLNIKSTNPYSWEKPSLPWCITLFRNVLFSFQIFGDFIEIILFLIPTLIPVWSEKIFSMTWVLLNLFTPV